MPDENMTNEHANPAATPPGSHIGLRASFPRELPVQLTTEHLARAARDRAELEEKLEARQDQHDEDNRKAKGEIAELEAKIADLGKVIRRGERWQLVTCSERYGEGEHVGTIEVVRSDTGAVVERRVPDLFTAPASNAIAAGAALAAAAAPLDDEGDVVEPAADPEPRKRARRRGGSR